MLCQKIPCYIFPQVMFHHLLRLYLGLSCCAFYSDQKHTHTHLYQLHQMIRRCTPQVLQFCFLNYFRSVLPGFWIGFFVCFFVYDFCLVVWGFFNWKHYFDLIFLFNLPRTAKLHFHPSLSLTIYPTHNTIKCHSKKEQ